MDKKQVIKGLESLKQDYLSCKCDTNSNVIDEAIAMLKEHKCYEDPNEYIVMLYSPKTDGNVECVINAITVSVKVDPKKKPNYGLIEKKAKDFLSPMGTEFRASEIRAIGFYPRAGY